MIFDFEAPLWRWEVRTELWTFVSLPAEDSETVRELMGTHEGRGFGAVRVRAAIGITTWRTSIFPDGDHYVLPVKRSVREAEGLDVGRSAQVQGQPGSTEKRLLRGPIRASWLRCRRSMANQATLAPGALPAHPSGAARYATSRWIQVELIDL